MKFRDYIDPLVIMLAVSAISLASCVLAFLVGGCSPATGGIRPKENTMSRDRVVISMTTVPERNGTLHETIASLVVQTRTPDAIHVYMTPWCKATVVHPLVRYFDVPDRGPITKLSAVIDDDLPRDTIVVTVDDDQSYAPHWLSSIATGAALMDNCAVGFSGWNVAGFLGHEWNAGLRPGPRGLRESNVKYPDTFLAAANPGRCDVLEGWSGAAYRKHFFSPDIMRSPDLYGRVDDVWISSYLMRKGIPRVLLGPAMMLKRKQPQLAGLHNRPDFLALNRAAARHGFGS